ncbi:MAG: 3-coathanger stack domain-containing protein [Thermoanaerobaculia bacterium]
MTSTTLLGSASIVAACLLATVPPAFSGTLNATNHAKFSGNFGLEAAPGSACGANETVELDNEPVIADVTACNFIRATNTTVTGTVDFTAGVRVSLGDGFETAAGADFSVGIDDTLTTLAFVTDGSPAGLATYKAAFRLSMDDISIPAIGSSFVVHLAGFGNGGRRHFEVRLKRNVLPPEDRLVLAAREDDGTVVVMPFGQEVMLPAGFNLIEVDWRAGGGTGRFLISLNGVPFGGLVGLDNFQAQIDRVEWGITDGDVAAITGHLDMDDFSSTD